MNINELYIKYKDKSANKIDADTKNNILSNLSKIQTVNSVKEANDFINILALCRKAQIAMEGEKRNNTFRTLLSTGEEGVYVDDNSYINNRFMYELIQNVDDCKYSSLQDCKLDIDFDLDNDIMTLAYNEQGFLPKDVIAISDIGNSTKNHHKSVDQREVGLDQNDFQEIGEKGIGFKSIFGLADKVEIKSGFFNFYFDCEDFTIPKVLKVLNTKKTNGTVLKIYLNENITSQLYKMLEKKYKNTTSIINENPILFLNKITEIRYTCKNGFFGFKVSRNTNESNIKGEMMKIEYISSDPEQCRTIKCYRYTKEINYTIEECKSRFGVDEQKERKYKIEIITLADLKHFFEGRLYSFFPTEQSLSVPMIIHSPFKLNSARTKIANQSKTGDSTNLWFIHTKNETIQFIYEVLSDLALKIGFKIINFIPDFNIVSNLDCLLYDTELSRDEILNLKLFESTTGEHLAANELCILDKSDISLNDAKIIHKLLNIQTPMLNEKPKLRYTKDYGFKKIEDIDNHLFELALSDKSQTNICLKYLKDYIPNNFKGKNSYILDENQITYFSEFPNIIDFINTQTINYLKNTPSISFRLKSLPKESDEDLNRVKDYCNAKNGLDKTLSSFISNVSFVQDDFYEKDIYFMNCLFGSNIIETFNSLLKNVNIRYKNFLSFIRFDEIEKEMNHLINSNSCNETEFLDKIYEIRKLQKNILGRQYKNVLQLINESGTKPQRFLMEILQNIDDCIYEETPAVDISFKNNKLVVLYNETGFKKEHVASITAIGDSTKKYIENENLTGEKGIGFKSIFNVANKVEIHSNKFHFKLTSDEPTLPLRIDTKENTKGTRLEIEVKNGHIDEYFNENFLCKMCLCLKKVKNLTINNKPLKIIEKSNERIVQFNQKHEYYRFVYSFNISDINIRKERYDDSNANEKQQITYLVPKENKDCHIYSTFPTLETTKVPVIIDANLKLNTSRESILEENIWNKEIIKHIHDGFLWTLDQIKNIDYKKLAEIIPYDGYITQNFSSDYYLKDDIQSLPVYKVYNTNNKFISLKNGFIANELDKFIIKKWGYPNPKDVTKRVYYRPDCIDFDLEKITDSTFYTEPNFVDYCLDLADSDSYDVIHPKNLKDETFRNLLYNFLQEKYEKDYISESDFKEIGLEDWEIIPITQNKKTSYVKYSGNIYSASNIHNIPKDIMILEQDIMSIDLFQFIYYDSNPNQYINIKEYSETIILDEFVEKINSICSYESENNIGNELLKLYHSSKETFKLCVSKRIDEIQLSDIYFKNRKNEIISLENCYLPYEDEIGSILDYVIVDNKYVELAKLLNVECISEIDKINLLTSHFTSNSLLDLFKLKSLSKNIQFFNQLYLSMFAYGYYYLIQNEVYLKLMDSIEIGLEMKIQHIKNLSFSIDCDYISKYSSTLLNIFSSYPNHYLKLENMDKLIEFDNYNVINDIKNDLQTRKSEERIIQANSLIDNCYYFENLGTSILPIRLHNNHYTLLINQNITSEYDIVSTLKTFFQNAFSLSLNVTRDTERYTRDYYEEISSIDYNDNDEFEMTIAASFLNHDNVSEIKDFMCKPLHINNKIIGGYARTCPLCGAKVLTELTGMRLYRFKENNYMYEFISCPNCYENLRYSSDLKIDQEEFKNNYISFTSIINGEKWSVNHKKIRLGHKAVLNALNKKK